MERILLAAALALLVAGCGTAGKVPAQKDPVNIGYGTVDRKDLTAAVSKVDVRPHETVTYSSMFDYLRGRVPGVLVTTDNRIYIRGIGTNSSSTSPLILVDGVQISERDLSGINPSDVRSVEVIKDGSSAIYGVQGANGVILISTIR